MPTASAWDLIGFDGQDDEGRPACVRIVGGRTLYEAVMFNDGTPGTHVKLARIQATDRGLREVSRWVHPDTQLEVVLDD